MKSIPYYTEQHMRKNKKYTKPSKKCVSFLKALYRENVFGELPVSNPEEIVSTWREYKSKNRHCIKFDISKFFLSIDHKKLLAIIEKYSSYILSSSVKDNYNNIYKKEIENFLSCTIYKNKTLPIASGMWKVLALIYLLPVINVIKNHRIQFLYFADDFLLFFKTQKQSDQFYYSILVPLLNKYDLVLSFEKTKFKRTNESLSFLGYVYRSGYFSIEQKRVDIFYKKINKIIKTSRKKEKNLKACISIINRKFNAFFHYYKWGNVKTLYKTFDNYIKSSLRSAYRDKNISSNFYFSDECFLKNGLKLATEIFTKNEILKKERNKSNSISQKKKETIFFLKKLSEVKYVIRELEDFIYKI